MVHRSSANGFKKADTVLGLAVKALVVGGAVFGAMKWSFSLAMQPFDQRIAANRQAVEEVAKAVTAETHSRARSDSIMIEEVRGLKDGTAASIQALANVINTDPGTYERDRSVARLSSTIATQVTERVAIDSLQLLPLPADSTKKERKQ
jgi:hypothetical protein